MVEIMTGKARAERHSLTPYENGIKAKDLMLDAGLHLTTDPRYIKSVEALLEAIKELDVVMLEVALDDEMQTQKKQKTFLDGFKSQEVEEN